MSDAAAAATASIIKETDEGIVVPEVSEIMNFTAAKCSQFMDELVTMGLVGEPISGFTKMSLPDKRDALGALLKALTGAEEEAAPAETPTPPFEVVAEAPAATVVEASTPTIETAPKVAAAKAEAKAKAKKAPAKVKATTDDPVQQYASRVEKMDDPSEVSELIRVIQEDKEFSEFKLGGALGKFQDNTEWYTNLGYAKFSDWVETTHGISYRKAMYCIEIYRKILESEVTWEQFENIGWTKVIILLPIVNKDNVKEWVEKAKSLNSISLQAHVKEALKPATEGEAPATPTIVTKTFKLHPDQKEIVEAALKQAKEQSGTAVDTQALELICQDYMGTSGGYPTLAAALSATRKKSESSEAFLADVIPMVELLVPELEVTVSISSKAE